jgi:hypothetical protein
MRDDLVVKRLNESYIQAILSSNVAWFEANLAPEFACIESDGTLLDRKAFLEMVAKPSELAEYRLASVDFQRWGGVALVRALGEWTAKDGRVGKSRYVDVYARNGSVWKCVSAQITRPALPPS